MRNNKPAFNLGFNRISNQVRATVRFTSRDLYELYRMTCTSTYALCLQVLEKCKQNRITKRPNIRAIFTQRKSIAPCLNVSLSYQGIHSQMAEGHFHSFRPNVGDTYDQEAIAQFLLSKNYRLFSFPI